MGWKSFEILKPVIGGAARVFRRTFPWRTQHAPRSLVFLTDRHAVDSVYTPIHTAPTAVHTQRDFFDLLARKPPVESIDGNWVVSTDPITHPSVVRLQRARILSDNQSYYAVINQRGNVVREFSWDWARGSNNHDDKPLQVFDQRWFPKPRSIPGELLCLLSGGGGRSNYYHWMVDIVPRALLAGKAGINLTRAHLLIPGIRTSFQREVLESLGVAGERVIEGTWKTHLEAESIIAVQTTRKSFIPPTWAIELLREFGLRLAPRPPRRRTKRKLYLRRGDASRRRIINETEIEAILGDLGFEPVQLSAMTVADQIALFREAEIVVAFHGAGLTNMIFAPPGCRIIELFAGGYFLGYYHDLAQVCGHDYDWAWLSPSCETSEREKYTDQYIDPKEFRSCLAGKLQDRRRVGVSA